MTVSYCTYVCSNTALDIFDLDGQLPEIAMMGQQANISLKYYDERAAFHEDKKVHEADFMECDCKDYYPGAQE